MYLMIRNPGVCDPASLTLLGASTTRYSHYYGSIGQFGSGFKYAVALCLRYGIPVTVISSLLKMEFFSKPKFIKGNTFNQICVKYSGKDLNGINRSSTDELGWTQEWGVDWNDFSMAWREFVANGLDGCLAEGSDWKKVEIEVVSKPRAKADYTAVFLPLEPLVLQQYQNLGKMFLHFSNPDLLDKKLIPKQEPGKIMFYKQGVLVHSKDGESIFDYNFGHELSLDESRNAQEWDVRYCASKAIANADAAELSKVFSALVHKKDMWELKLDTSYMSSQYASSDVKKEREDNWKTAWETVAGEDSVATSDLKPVTDLVAKKGFTPIPLDTTWVTTLEGYGVKTESDILSGIEKDGKKDCEPNKDMMDSLEKVWNLLVAFDLTNGREKPPLRAFEEILSAESMRLGYYKEGTVYIHTDIGSAGHVLDQTMLEEVVHHVTGASDFSRDLQDFLFRLITKIAL